MPKDKDRELRTDEPIEEISEVRPTTGRVSVSVTPVSLVDLGAKVQPFNEKALEIKDRLTTLHQDRDRRLARLQQMAEAGETTQEYANFRAKELTEIYADRENCKTCKGPCEQPLGPHPLNKPRNVRG